MEGIEYPVSLKDINKFEEQNPTISIEVLGYNEKRVYPLRNSKYVYKREHNIDLILIKEEKEEEEKEEEEKEEEEKEEGVSHYCLIKDDDAFSRLLLSQISKHGKKIFL